MENIERILKQQQKSLVEWKEDVLRPRLIMTKLVRPRVRVSDEEVRHAFEEHYGEKVECRMVLWPKQQKNLARVEYEGVKAGHRDFDFLANIQANAALATTGGQIVISRHSTANPALEKAAFALNAGEVSPLIETPEGIVLLKCVKRLPADRSKKLADVREALSQEVMRKKIQQEIPKAFEELRKQAQPRLLLKDDQRLDK